MINQSMPRFKTFSTLVMALQHQQIKLTILLLIFQMAWGLWLWLIILMQLDLSILFPPIQYLKHVRLVLFLNNLMMMLMSKVQQRHFQFSLIHQVQLNVHHLEEVPHQMIQIQRAGTTNAALKWLCPSLKVERLICFYLISGTQIKQLLTVHKEV